MIELKDFVSQVLTEITNGTEEAKEELKEVGATVNDRYRLSSKDKVTEVKFDISISTTEENSKGGKAGIFVGKTGIGGEKGKTTKDSSVGKIQFSLMLHLPNGNLEGKG